MKYKVTVNNQSYEVEIEDLNARPVVALVEGERFEVVPENATKETKPKAEKKPFSPHQRSASPVSSSNVSAEEGAQTAPLPGTVVSVFVKAGDKVEAGQVILVIEAMKMKNSIRSLFSGVIEQVLVETGQSVAHKQPLVKFRDMSDTAWM